MKRWVAFVACVLLAAALAFLGLCGRYQVQTTSSRKSDFEVVTTTIRVDRLTGKAWLLDSSMPVWMEIP